MAMVQEQKVPDWADMKAESNATVGLAHSNKMHGSQGCRPTGKLMCSLFS